MPINDPRPLEQAFREDTDASVAVQLQSQQNALKYLRSILTDARGAGLLYGPASSGKSTIIRSYTRALHHDVAFAAIDGSGLTPQVLLSEVLSQFGYKMTLESADDLLRMVKVFAVQQTRVCQPPIIIVENIEKMLPGALRILCLLASLTFQSRFAIRLVLTGNGRAPFLLKSEGMSSISQRTVSVYEVEPFSAGETMLYLHGRLRSCGVQQVDQVFPMNVCDRLHRSTGGRPGALNERAKELLEEAESQPPTELDVERYKDREEKKPPVPQLIVTWDGETVEQYVFKERKVTIGRSDLADIVIRNEYVSKFHALVRLYSDALVLIDLNSSNGVFVNSVKINSTILRSDDIISVANHRIKVVDAPSADSDRISSASADATAKMRALDDLRNERKARSPFLSILRGMAG